jgi:hypothetical protein
MATKEVANRSNLPVAVNENLDMCIVGDTIVAFDISRILHHSIVHPTNVNARGVPVLTVNSVIRGVDGNKGVGFLSGVAEENGFIIIQSGAENVNSSGLPTARHLSECLMNCDKDSTTNGTKGRIYTNQSTSPRASESTHPCEHPPRTPEYLERLKALKRLIDIEAQADSVVQFDRLKEMSAHQAAIAYPGDGILAQMGRTFTRWSTNFLLTPGELAYGVSKYLMPLKHLNDQVDNLILA